MGLLIFFVLFFIYFSFFHDKALEHFGLTERDNSLMWMGCYIFVAVTLVAEIVAALIAGQAAATLFPLVVLALCVFFLVSRYQRL
jgi:hypothetical protein